MPYTIYDVLTYFVRQGLTVECAAEVDEGFIDYWLREGKTPAQIYRIATNTEYLSGPDGFDERSAL